MLKECPRAIGFMGSDRYGELDDAEQEWLRFVPLAETAIRFALATSENKVARLANKQSSGESIVVATSYPKAVDRQFGALAIPLVLGGSLESKPQLIGRVDAIYDVVHTGNTIRANNLKIVMDNLGSVTVGAVYVPK